MENTRIYLGMEVLKEMLFQAVNALLINASDNHFIHMNKVISFGSNINLRPSIDKIQSYQLRSESC